MIVNPISSKKPAKAKIIVTAPTGSTVTCDGVVGTEVSGTWEFSVNVGNHTIIATLGTKTKSVDVFCDVVGEYQVEIDYKLWLYKDGDECEEVTGGWGKQTGTMSGYTQDNNLLTVIQNSAIGFQFAPTSNNKFSVFGPNSKIDTTGYETLHFMVSDTTASSTGIYGDLVIDSGSSRHAAGSTGTKWNRYVEPGVAGVGDLTLDVSSSSDVFVCMWFARSSASGTSLKTNVSKVWLE